MWKGPGLDPGGGPESGPPPGSSQELSDLKDQFEQQQVLIAQLKEMIRKNEQSNVTQEKVDEYMNTLSKRGGRKKSKRDDDIKKTVDLPASQKISLLRQQVEENKVRLAERGKSKKGLEDMVTQLQAQLDDSLQLISQTPLSISLQDTKVEYTENSSSQELYTVLLTKEKRVSDLLAKVQKLESNVLDLQENLKEKDSVIDARTKAITLMTENLSRKGKNTLDALDETKEQMRKMQENFVSLEAEMKARQMKLLDDLRQKNYEIAELQEINEGLERQRKLATEETANEEFETLKAENLKLSETVSEKDMKIKDLEASQLRQNASEGTENEEISKLKKQLEESNKNMIKVKAQQKSKVKELTKKVDAFKKVSDANAELVKLQTENGHLSQKIAELEEEKGSLQLKLVESDSTKGSESTERVHELEEKIQDHETQLEEKDKVISILEAEISRSKTEIETLSEKLDGLSHLENAQVTSEMASIQFEEQLERVETEKLKFVNENEELTKEKEQLLETIDQLRKEKQEISTKLDHYIQDNMELIDKLEKLSAEKVSSAESIEIVEGLTQQEKLELEAYQKNLDIVAGNLKCSEENLPQADLNESVNELTEETSELLQKIELFTVERREVMEKMEQLKHENQSLSQKIEEIENNRDVLAETYEQLQSEKEVLDTKVEMVEAENVELKEKMKQGSEEFHQEEKEIEDKSERVRNLEEELESVKKAIEEKQKELETLDDLVRGLQYELEKRNGENSHLNNTIIELNRTLSDLENDNKSIQMKISKLEEHKTSLNQQIDKNQEELEAVINTEWENRRLLESKDNEITKLMKERDNTDSVIADLQKTIREKDESFHKLTTEFKNKYLSLQKQLEENSGSLQNITRPLETKIEELTSKNKDQLEKMKKIAANLKKKTQAYQELEERFKETQDRHDVELKTSLHQLQDLEVEVSHLRQKFEVKSEEALVLEEKNVELQNTITDLRVKVDKNNEVNLQQELLLTKENLGSVESSLQTKIQELEMIIETQESELVKTKERCSKLEEGISFVEERRLSLERKANELGVELEEKVMTCEEMSRSEDMLEQRLGALIAHDEAIEKKLQDALDENQDLKSQSQKVRQKNEKLKKKLDEFKEEMRSLEGQDKVVEELESQNESLKKQIHHLETELKTLHTEYEKMVEESRNDFDKVNGDWQTQFDEVLQERTELMITCEKFGEELKEIAEREVSFNNELMEYKAKLQNSETEIRNYEEQIQRLSKEREELEFVKRKVSEDEETIRRFEANEEKKRVEVEELRKIIEQKENAIKTCEGKIESLCRESEDRGRTESELKTIIAEKDSEIENCRKQASNSLSSFSSFFDNVPREDPLISQLREEISAARTRIEELETTIQGLSSLKSSQPVPETTPHQDIPTFVWSGQTNDPFDFIQPTTAPIQETQQQPEQHENSQQDLLDKIKTLQFMLYDVEKDKEDALNQCQQLTNELTRLIYEKQMPVAMKNVECQIMQVSDFKDSPDSCTELRKLEFEESRPPVCATIEEGPVVEEICQAKEAYVCFGDDTQNQVESQILSAVDIVDTAAGRVELRKLEFEATKPSISSADGPVKEETCTAKEAYLCYNTGFGENDDGWGWGPEEAKLEEEHAQRSENLEDRIRVLEMERVNHLEEIRQLQVKSGKLIKKLKEFKVKNEELTQRKKSESDLFNLDDTIQEELKVQIQQVEKKLKETAAEFEKEKSEKVAILKRVDVLAAANERMVEMKEKQEIELLGWQQNCRDLNAKLERLEWGDDGFSSVDKSSPEKPKQETSFDVADLNRKIEELNETINDLTLDNEELQAILEEQRRLRIETEKSTIQMEHSEALQEEKKQLDDQLRASGEEKKHLQDQVNELIKKNAELSDKFESIEQQNVALDALQVTKEEIIARLNEQLREAEIVKQELVMELQERNVQIESLKNLNDTQLCFERDREVLLQQIQEKNQEIDSLRNSMVERGQLTRELQEKNQEIDSIRNSLVEKEQLTRELQEKNAQKEQLGKELQEKNSEIDSLRALVDSQSFTTQEKDILLKELQEKNSQIDALRESMDVQISSLKHELNEQVKKAETLLEEKQTVTSKDAEIGRLSAAMEQMTQEWEMRIDQRGLDVAESWKLHLESRESEFAQMEQLLRKEIQELEEKINALVNENNELRNNVDAEIRNEVDRVAALQQQINERQGCVNDLTTRLQEKEEEMEKLQLELETTKKYLDDERETLDGMFKVVKDYSQESIDGDVESLVRVFADKEGVIVGLRQELDEVRAKVALLTEEQSRNLENISRLNVLLDERTLAVATLNSRIEEVQNLKDYEHENIDNLQQNLLEYQQANTDIGGRLQSLNSQVDDKEREIGRLRQELEEKERQQTYAVENISQDYRASINEQAQEIELLKRRLIDVENHYEELLHGKDTEMEGVRFELKNQSDVVTGKNREFEDLSIQLQTKFEECTTLQQKISEQTVLIDEENKQLTELRAIIEEQVLKIEELKTELYQKSNDYDSLIAEMDISRTSVKDTEEIQRPKREENEDLTEPVNRAELDLALYMLHQRDVRCEELTVELTQLLEERDTLQLRLSNVIREKEELGRHVKAREEDEEVPSSSGTVPRVRTEVGAETVDPLTTKLSELRMVDYKKDKTIVDEQELRRLQQLSIMHQHRDDASRLPPEAAARLVDASYTLSRDVQSPSKVLLNWLWGRSTPRVNNI